MELYYDKWYFFIEMLLFVELYFDFVEDYNFMIFVCN